ncbi:Uncharacterised protein [Chromobacterium vaccinii]|nr:Uncharacterised protein [Chromobacterium vaccinii]
MKVATGQDEITRDDAKATALAACSDGANFLIGSAKTVYAVATTSPESVHELSEAIKDTASHKSRVIGVGSIIVGGTAAALQSVPAIQIKVLGFGLAYLNGLATGAEVADMVSALSGQDSDSAAVKELTTRLAAKAYSNDIAQPELTGLSDAACEVMQKTLKSLSTLNEDSIATLRSFAMGQITARSEMPKCKKDFLNKINSEISSIRLQGRLSLNDEQQNNLSAALADKAWWTGMRVCEAVVHNIKNEIVIKGRSGDGSDEKTAAMSVERAMSIPSSQSLMHLMLAPE